MTGTVQTTGNREASWDWLFLTLVPNIKSVIDSTLGLDLCVGNGTTDRSCLNVTERSITAEAKYDEMKWDAVSAVRAHEIMSLVPGIYLFLIFFSAALRGLAINCPRMPVTKLCHVFIKVNHLDCIMGLVYFSLQVI